MVAVLCKLPIWESPLARVSALPPNVDPNDAMWFLNWLPYSLGHGLSPFSSDYLNHPLGFNLMWNTWMPAIGLLLSPVTVLAGPALSDNIATTGSLALASFFAYLALHRYVRNRFAAAVGGLIYGFSPYMVAQDTVHAQMVAAAVTLPLAMMLVDEILVRQRLNPWLLGVLLAAAGIFQFFVLEEYFITELGALLLLTLILAALHRSELKQRLRFAATAFAVATVITAAVLAYPVWVLQLHGPNRVFGVPHDPEEFVTDLLNPIVPTSVQLIAPHAVTSISHHFTGNVGEWNGYLGIALLAVFIATAVVQWRRPVVRAATIFAGAMTLLSLGPHLHVGGNVLHVPLPWWIVSRIPLIRDIQANRLMVYVYLAVALVAATAVASVWRARRGPLLASAMTVAMVALLAPAVPLPSADLFVPSYFTSAAVSEIPAGSTVLAVPCPCPATADAVGWQIASGMRFKLIGGYVLGDPSPGQAFMKAFAVGLKDATSVVLLAPAYRATFQQQLRANHVRAIVMGGEVVDPQVAVEILSQALGFDPQARDGVYVWLIPPA